jgi:hypothetical protein
VIWTKKYIEHQGREVKMNVIYQDNTSTINMLQNRNLSPGKNMQHFNIKLFYVTDLIGNKKVRVEYCPTDAIIANYMAKPAQSLKDSVTGL